MTLISMDTSTKKSGVAKYVDGKLVDYQLIDYDKVKDVEERINLMGTALLLYLKKNEPDAIWIEHPQGQGSNVSMVGKLCEILGIVRAYALSKNCEYHELMPSVWRKYSGRPYGNKKRNELKQISIEYVKEEIGVEVNDDVADAIVIGHSVINFFKLLEK